MKYRNFENYLYHPNNLEELEFEGFNKESYVTEITEAKNRKCDYEIANIDSARRGYEEFRNENENLKDQNSQKIVDGFKSNKFEDFYKFYDMKKNHEHYSKFNLKPQNLVQTEWFKAQIKNILK